MSLYFQHKTTYIPRKVQEEKRKVEERKEFFQNKLIHIAVVAFTIMVIAQMTVFAVFATKGEEISNLQKQQETVLKENTQLASQIYNLGSVDKLKTFASQMNLTVAKKVVNVKVDNTENVALGQ